MKPFKTRYEQLEKKRVSIDAKLYDLEKEKRQKSEELTCYCNKHKSLSYDSLKTDDVKKLLSIYDYFDKKYFVSWQGGLRCDDRGMKLTFWLDKDPDYIVFHLSSTSKNVCFSGSTSWLVPANTFEDKVEIIKRIKKDISKILLT